MADHHRNHVLLTETLSTQSILKVQVLHMKTTPSFFMALLSSPKTKPNVAVPADNDNLHIAHHCFSMKVSSRSSFSLQFYSILHLEYSNKMLLQVSYSPHIC